MLTSDRIRVSRLVVSLVLVLAVLCFPFNLDAKAWLNRHIAEIRPDGFLLQTKFYSIAIHTAADTKVRCKKQSLLLTDLQVQDLVTVEGSTRNDGNIEATKVIIHR
jgi:hypothetical protein